MLPAFAVATEIIKTDSGVKQLKFNQWESWWVWEFRVQFDEPLYVDHNGGARSPKTPATHTQTAPCPSTISPPSRPTHPPHVPSHPLSPPILSSPVSTRIDLLPTAPKIFEHEAASTPGYAWPLNKALGGSFRLHAGGETCGGAVAQYDSGQFCTCPAALCRDDSRRDECYTPGKQVPPPLSCFAAIDPLPHPLTLALALALALARRRSPSPPAPRLFRASTQMYALPYRSASSC